MKATEPSRLTSWSLNHSTQIFPQTWNSAVLRPETERFGLGQQFKVEATEARSMEASIKDNEKPWRHRAALGPSYWPSSVPWATTGCLVVPEHPRQLSQSL